MAYIPVVSAFSIVTITFDLLYVDMKKVTSEVDIKLYENGIRIQNYEAVLSDLDEVLEFKSPEKESNNGNKKRDWNLYTKVLMRKHNLI